MNHVVYIETWMTSEPCQFVVYTTFADRDGCSDCLWMIPGTYEEFA